MHDDISIGSGTFRSHGGGATSGAGTYHGGGTATGSGVRRAVKDLARVAVAVAVVLAFAFVIGAGVRSLRPSPVHAAVLVTSQGDVFPSSGTTCEEDSARLDVDNLSCRRHPGPR